MFLLGNMAIFLYREQQAFEEDPYQKFMSDGAQLWRRLTPHGENFTFRDPIQELPLEVQREKQEAKRLRIGKAQGKQMMLADSRRKTLRRLRSIQAAMKVARAEPKKKERQEKQDSIRNRILRRLAKEKQGNLI